MKLYDDYTLNVEFTRNKALIEMQMLIPVVNTSELQNTYELLQKHLPTVLMTKCYNNLNLPFQKEVLNTELGHLFEHIILENLCLVKMRNGANSASFSGRTHWNWKDNSYGSFKIVVRLNELDLVFFDEAFAHSISVFNKILISGRSSKYYL